MSDQSFKQTPTIMEFICPKVTFFSLSLFTPIIQNKGNNPCVTGNMISGDFWIFYVTIKIMPLFKLALAFCFCFDGIQICVVFGCLCHARTPHPHNLSVL